MKVYVVTTAKHDGDMFDGLVTFDKDAAIKSARNELERMSEYDRKRTDVYVSVYECLDAADRTANKIYQQALDDAEAVLESTIDIFK